MLAKAGYFARKGGTNVREWCRRNRGCHRTRECVDQDAERAGRRRVAARSAASDTYSWKFNKISEYVNGEGVEIFYEPKAISDGDSIVQFRRSEVISTGDLFSTITYPMIDVKAGGTIDGVIDALNHILDITAAEYRSQGRNLDHPGTRPSGGCGRSRVVSQHDRDHS